jgi:hypothetical protein
MTEKEIMRRLLEGEPFEGLNDIRVIRTEGREPEMTPSPEGVLLSVAREMTRPGVVYLPDSSVYLEISGMKIPAFLEIKSQINPKLLKQIGPWLTRLKMAFKDTFSILVSPYLSVESQQYCLKNQVDFIDLSGNISIGIPGKIVIQRLNRPNKFTIERPLPSPFSRSSSRTLRVLLQYPEQAWTLTSIAKELKEETQRRNRGISFELSLSTISKALKFLEEELLVSREDKRIFVSEPRQLLLRWAEKYISQYKAERRKAIIWENRLGLDLVSTIPKLKDQFPELNFAVTGSAAASLIAPFVEIDQIDILVADAEIPSQQNLTQGGRVGPDLIFITPPDAGAFMYSSEVQGVPVASDEQIYLDCYARGGRDAKQADFFLENVLEEQWQKR